MTMDPLYLKIILIFVMMLVTIVFGLLPVKVLKLLSKRASHSSTLEEHRWPSLALCLLSCFTGGVFLSTCFLHLLPEVNHNLNEIKENYGWHVDYPMAELISCLGFFLVYFLEEIVISLFMKGEHGHSHGPPRNRSRSNTNSESRSDEPSEKRDGKNKKGDHDHGHSKNSRRDAAALSSKPSCVTPLLPAPVPVLPVVMVLGDAELAEPERCEIETVIEGAKDEDPPILMVSRPHAHSHGVRSVTLVIALSFHSIIEGLAFGIQDTTETVITLFLTIVIHECIIAFSVGLQLARTHAHQLRWVVASIVALAFMTPIGCAVGISIQEASINEQVKDTVVMVFEGLAVGTFLYVTFFEVFLHERENDHPNMLKLLATVIGFGLIAALRAYGHEHDNEGHAAESISWSKDSYNATN